jgi:hypothetical protein
MHRWKGRLRKYADRYLHRPDLENDISFQNIYRKVGTSQSKYTLTSMEKCYALYKAVQHITKGNLLGDIVECGVWRGGARC